MLLAIDPGNIQSAWVCIKNDYSINGYGLENNYCLLKNIKDCHYAGCDYAIIEMVASYGMAVGATVFETCVWIGRFEQALSEYNHVEKIYRKDVKLNLCGQTRAKDANIRQALIDRFGVVGTKKNPGWFYGFKADIWAAYAVGITWLDTQKLY